MFIFWLDVYALNVSYCVSNDYLQVCPIIIDLNAGNLKEFFEAFIWRSYIYVLFMFL